MKITTTHPKYGEICLNWAFWSGKYTLFFNGNELEKTGKMSFTLTDPESEQAIPVVLTGNNFKGYIIKIDADILVLSPPAKWYDIVFGVIPAVIFFFFIQGAIGGAVAGGLGVLGTFAAINCQSMRKKIFVCLGLSAISTICALVLSVLIALLYQSLGLV